MRTLPPITKNLIIINVLMYFAQVVTERYGVDLTDALGLHFFLASDFQVYQLVSYMFLHGSFTHILFNMFALWMFGCTMEREWGPKRFILFYFVCGIGAGLTQEVSQYVHYLIEGMGNFQMVNANGSLISMNSYLNLWTTIGASGACYGILLGFGMTYPEERILLLIPPIPIKAKYFVIGYAVIELLSGLGERGDSIAHFAHLGGMLFGLLLILYWRRYDRRHNGGSGFTSWEEYRPTGKKGSFFDKWRKMFKFGKKEPENNYGYRQQDYDYNARRKANEAEIDRILEKVKKSGYESLNESEKKKLFDNSKK